MKAIAIIGARLNSSRLEGKHLLDLAGKTLVHRVIDRLYQCKTLDKIILATTNDGFNAPLVQAVEGQITAYAHAGDVNDLIDRIDGVVENESPDYLVYICGDCPLIEPGFIDHALTALMAAPEKDTIRLAPGISSIHEGMLFYSYNGWKRLLSISQSPEAREHVGLGDRQTPTLNILSIADSADFSYPLHRISVDTVADYEFMREIYSRWYKCNPPETIVDLHWVQQQLARDSRLTAINQHVLQKDPKKTYQKVFLYCHVGEKIGMGHLKRCSIIAEGIQENLGLGTNIIIQGNKQSIPWLKTPHIWVPDEHETFEKIRDDSSFICILDFHPDYINIDCMLAACKKIKPYRKIIALDKLTALSSVADHVFIPSFYSSVTGKNIHFGWECYLLDIPKTTEKKKQIIVLTGGSDSLGFGETLPPLLETTSADDFELIWIQGPYAPPPNLKNRDRWTLLVNPPNLGDLIACSEVAITTYGVSFFECLAANCIAILLPSIDLCSDKEIQALKKENICTIIEHMENLPIEIENYLKKNSPYITKLENAKAKIKLANGLKLLCKLIENYTGSRHEKLSNL